MAALKAASGFQSRRFLAAYLDILGLCECCLSDIFQLTLRLRTNFKMDGWNYLEALRLAGEEQHELRQRMRVRRRTLRRSIELFDDMSETAFVKLYRLPQYAVRTLIEDIRGDMPRPVRQSAISVETKVIAALRFFATGSYQAAVGNDMSLGISQTSTSRSIHEVVAALNARVAPRLLRFPESQQDRNRIKQRFFDATGFPGVIGAIDCTHISIVRPVVNEQAYINRKGSPTINVQAICNYDMRILSIDASYPGCTGDAHIWRNCAVKQKLVERFAANERNEYLLGDSGYASEPWLVLPILNTLPGTPEAHFTNVHCRTRCCVERCFGLLKARFRCLLQHRTLHYSHQTAALIINSCAALHNLALDLRLPNPEPLQAVELAQERLLEAGDVLPPADLLADVLGPARAVRNALVERLWRARNA